jgi:hypothetical protein
VNNFIKSVKTRTDAHSKQGVVPQSCCSMTEQEFCLLHRVLQKCSGNNNIIYFEVWCPHIVSLLSIPAPQLLHRSRMQHQDYCIISKCMQHNSFSNALKTKLNWSKMSQKTSAMHHGKQKHHNNDDLNGFLQSVILNIHKQGDD